MKIGLAYLKGSVPGFEDFGNLPTDIVKSNGLVNGIKAHKALDALIIPGGSLLESDSISPELAIEIKKIAKDGKPVIGICSGFQAIANETNTGRKSPCPIIKKGIGLLNVNFSPFISNDRVEAFTTNDSFFTNNITKITGFHSHTYGKIDFNSTTPISTTDTPTDTHTNIPTDIPIIYSKLKRANYKDTDDSVVSGVRNDDGNVIGTMIHGILDENPQIVDNVLDFIDADEIAKKDIFERNNVLKIAIRSELGIDSGIKLLNSNSNFNLNFNSNSQNNIGQIPPVLMIASNGSDSGKTFITTGISGALTKRGMKIAILKVGPDVRDTIPSLYLTKGKMEDFASIKIGHLGWMEIKDVLDKLRDSDYDFVLIEGVMSVFTGLLNEKIPYSGAEIAISSNIPMLLVTGVNKGGIESAAIDIVSHANKLNEMGIAINGIILNKVYDMEIFNEASNYIKNKTNIDEIIPIPKISLDERSTIPEIEINLEDFSLPALNTIEKYLDLDKIANMAAIPEFNSYLDYEKIKKYFLN
jgi:cobyric acid synthase